MVHKTVVATQAGANTGAAENTLFRMLACCHFKRAMPMRSLIIFTCLAAVAGWLGAGCDQPVSPVARKKAQPQTNRITRATAPKPAEPPKEIRIGTIDYLDAQNGIRDVTFGQTDKSIPNLVETSRDDARQLKTCTRSDETNSLHGVPLKRVEYKFFRGELYAMQFEWKIAHPDSTLGRPPTTDLSGQLAAAYGAPRKHHVTQDGTDYIWRGRRVEINLSESLLPGVADVVKGGWAIPPTTSGLMVIRNLALSRAAESSLAAKPGQTSGEY